MQAGPNDSTSKRDAPEAEALRMARGIAQRVLADLERAGKRAQADRLAEILLLLADGIPLTDALPGARPAE